MRLLPPLLWPEAASSGCSHSKRPGGVIAAYLAAGFAGVVSPPWRWSRGQHGVGKRDCQDVIEWRVLVAGTRFVEDASGRSVLPPVGFCS